MCVCHWKNMRDAASQLTWYIENRSLSSTENLSHSVQNSTNARGAAALIPAANKQWLESCYTHGSSMVIFGLTHESSSILAISKTHFLLTKVGARPKLMGSRFTGAVSLIPVENVAPVNRLDQVTTRTKRRWVPRARDFMMVWSTRVIATIIPSKYDGIHAISGNVPHWTLCSLARVWLP